MIKRVRYLFTGVVQGVGFRPFIYRIATRHSLSGFVQNRPDGVVIEVEGPADAIHSFISGVNEELPPLADVSGISSEEVDIKNESAF
ncbi:MAG: acylphosphatase, partial [Syntrophales bacterium]